MFRGTITRMPVDDSASGTIAEGAGPRLGMSHPFALTDVTSALGRPVDVGQSVTFTTRPSGPAGRPQAVEITVVGPFGSAA